MRHVEYCLGVVLVVSRTPLLRDTDQNCAHAHRKHCSSSSNNNNNTGETHRKKKTVLAKKKQRMLVHGLTCHQSPPFRIVRLSFGATRFGGVQHLICGLEHRPSPLSAFVLVLLQLLPHIAGLDVKVHETLHRGILLLRHTKHRNDKSNLG